MEQPDLTSGAHPVAPSGGDLPPAVPAEPTLDGNSGASPVTGASGADTAFGPDDVARPAPEPGGVPAPVATESAKKRRGRRAGFEWLFLIVASLTVALVVRRFLIQAFYIPSASMTPTLEVNDRVLVNKLSYHLHGVHRGDIIVFTAPPGIDSPDVKDLIKRVVGLPGDTVEGRGGQIYIDGKVLDEPYLPPDVRSRDFPAAKVPTDGVLPTGQKCPCLWVLGDNREDSKDSTFFGPISERTIIGRAFVKIWPPSDLSLL